MKSTSSARKAVLVALVTAIWAVTAAAQNGQEAQPTQYKIGVVNLKTVFDAYKKQADQYADLENERVSKQKVIDELSEKITKAKERYDAQKEKMPETEKESLEEAIETDYSRYQAEFKRLQQDIDRKEKKILDDLFEDIRQAVQAVGAELNYHLIFEAGESGRSGVLYSSTTLNMTPRIIEHLNSTYKKP